MSKSLQPVRGTHDLIGDEARAFEAVIETARSVSRRFGFESVSTPIFEFTEVFKRTLGDTSDVVSKEMYMLEDRGGESLTLRPEFTAGLARAFMSNGLQHQLPLKWFSAGPVFRYERPQKGRQRQFHQVNFEVLGIAEPFSDVEVIALAQQVAKALNIADKLTLEINSLGDGESRANYRNALVEYLENYTNDLSQDSQRRLAINPMRILDSKDAKDKEIVVDAPRISSYYSDAAKQFFDQVKEGLETLGIDYSHNECLVRGLDYYSHTAFEFTTTELGAQNAVMAGGRYDGLIGMMGGNDTPAIGFAAGVERLMELSQMTRDKPRPVVILPMDASAMTASLSLAYRLREADVVTEILASGKLGKRMKKANTMHATHTIIIGENELASGAYTVKQLDEGVEKTLEVSHIIDNLSA